MSDNNALADQLEALASKATPGPWEADTIDNEGEYGSGPDTHSGFKSPVMLDPNGQTLFDAVNGDLIEVHEEYDEDGCYAWDEPGRCNFALIAALRNNLPAIIAALRAEQALAERDAEIVAWLRERSGAYHGRMYGECCPNKRRHLSERSCSLSDIANAIERGDYRSASDAE